MKNLFAWLRLVIQLLRVSLGGRPLNLVPFLSSPNNKIRWEAADTLSDFADASVIEPVFEALQKDYPAPCHF